MMPTNYFKQYLTISLLLLLAYISASAAEQKHVEDSAIYYINKTKENIHQTDSLRLFYVDKAYEFSLFSSNDSLIVISCYLKGLTYYFKGFYKASNKYYFKALENQYINKNQELLTNIYNNIGINYDKMVEHNSALEFYYKSLEIENNLGSKAGVAQTHINIALVYLWQKNYHKCYEYLANAQNYYQQNPDTFYLGLIHQNMMLYNCRAKDYFDEELIMYDFDKAIEYFTAIGYWNGLLETYFNVIKKLHEEEKHYSAEMYMHKALKIAELHNVTNSGIVLKIILEQVKNDSTNFIKNEKDLLAGLQVINDNGINSFKLIYLETLLNLYLKTGDSEKIISTGKAYIAASDSILNKERAIAFEELSFIHNLQSKEQLIINQQLELIVQKNRLRNSIIILLLLTILFGFVIYFYKFRIKKMTELYKRNIELINCNSNSGAFILHNESDGDKTKLLYHKIKSLVICEKLYLDSSLSVLKLANILNSNEKYISVAINSGYGNNFNNMINSHRINHAKIIMANNAYTLNQIMTNSGFKSRTTFIAAFKKHTGMSPGQFKKMAQNANFITKK